MLVGRSKSWWLYLYLNYKTALPQKLHLTTQAAELSSRTGLEREVALFHKEEIHGNSMQNRLPSRPPLLNQIKTNIEAYNSISRQPGVVFKACVACSAGTTPVFESLIQ